MTEERTHVPAMSLEELMDPEIDRLEATAKAGDRVGPGAWATGFQDLDVVIGGLRQGLVHLVFGTPGVGTSTFALDCARSVARAGGRVLYLSGQSPASVILRRVLSAECKIPATNLLKGYLREDDWTRLALQVGLIGEGWGRRLVVVDRPARDFATLAASDLFEQSWDLVVVDGVQLYTRATAPESLWAAHTRVAGDIKRTAMEHQVPFIVTVSVNRRPSQRSDYGLSGPLTLPDIASSNAHAADADVVIGLHRPDQEDRESPRAGEADLMVLKNRSGYQNTVIVAFQGHYNRFVDMAPSPPPSPPRAAR